MKLYNCVQIIYIRYEYLISYKWKSFVLINK